MALKTADQWWVSAAAVWEGEVVWGASGVKDREGAEAAAFGGPEGDPAGEPVGRGIVLVVVGRVRGEIAGAKFHEGVDVKVKGV